MAKRIPESELIINPNGSVYHLNLKPENIASDIIAVGDPDRVPKVSRYFDEIEFTVSKREFVTHTGWYQGKRMTVISTGMGTDNIEILMTELDALVNVDLKERLVRDNLQVLNIVRVGTSGSMRSDIPEDTLLASEYGVGLDTLMAFYPGKFTDLEETTASAIASSIGLDFKPYCVRGSESLLETIGEGLMKGNTVTCPGFFAPQGREVRIKPGIPDLIERLSTTNPGGMPLTNFEMETAGYYAMGRLLGHEVLSLNAIIANRVTKRLSKDPNGLIDLLIKHTLKKMAGI